MIILPSARVPSGFQETEFLKWRRFRRQKNDDKTSFVWMPLVENWNFKSKKTDQNLNWNFWFLIQGILLKNLLLSFALHEKKIFTNCSWIWSVKFSNSSKFRLHCSINIFQILYRSLRNVQKSHMRISGDHQQHGVADWRSLPGRSRGRGNKIKLKLKLLWNYYKLNCIKFKNCN